MVQAKPKKRKPEAVDFKRIKRKVGRRAPQRLNATDTSFKTKTVNVREQSLVADKGGVLVSSKNLTVAELLSKARHHNARVRRDALDGILEVIENYRESAQLRTQLPAIMTCVVELVNDDEKSVRVAVHNVLLALFATSSGGAVKARVHWCLPFLRLLFFHVRAGLNSLRLGCRMDAMRLVLLIARHFPDRVLAQRPALVGLVTSLLSSALSRVATTTSTAPAGSGMPSSSSGPNSSSALGQGAAGTSGAAAPASISVSAPGRGVGILQNFKDTKARAKAQAQQRARRSKALAVAAAAAASAAEYDSDSDSRTGAAGANQPGAPEANPQGLELWAEVARGLVQILQLGPSSRQASGDIRSGSDELKEDAQPASLDGETWRFMGVAHQENAALEASLLQQQEQQQQQQEHEYHGGASTQSATDRENMAKVVATLWAQVGTMYQATCGRGRSALAETRAVVADLGVSTELLHLCFTKVWTSADAKSAPMRSLVLAVEDSFPLKDAGHQESAASIFRINALIAQSLLELQQQQEQQRRAQELHDELPDADGGRSNGKRPQGAVGASLVDENALEAVSTWVSQSAARKKALDDARLPALVQVIRQGLQNGDAVKMTRVNVQLREAQSTLFGRALSEGIGRGAILHVLDAIRQMAVEEPSRINAAWVAALPRIAWEMGVNSDEKEEDRMRFLSVCFSILQILAVRGADQVAWSSFGRWLAPFFEARRGEEVSRPLAESMSPVVQLQLADLVSMLPVPRLSDPLLRAAASSVVALDELADEKSDPAGQLAVAIRLLRAPFVHRASGGGGSSDTQPSDTYADPGAAAESDSENGPGEADAEADVAIGLATFASQVCLGVRSAEVSSALADALRALASASDPVVVAVVRLVPQMLAAELAAHQGRPSTPHQLRHVAQIVRACGAGARDFGASGRIVSEALTLLSADADLEVSSLEPVFRLLPPSGSIALEAVDATSKQGTSAFEALVAGWARGLEFEAVHLDSLRPEQLGRDPLYARILSRVAKVGTPAAEARHRELQAIAKVLAR